MKSNSPVQVWEEKVSIPTYGVGKPEKNPIFLEKRVYQGSSGVVYPYPVIERILDVKEDKLYRGLFLENRYLKIMILPELGGRVQMAFDKVKQRHFVYHNSVIKPALVGLTGPWISGGIEFNWPQHHRPSTFDPIDFTIEEHDDGSKTVWVSEVERMFRTKGMAGFRLYPDKAYLEVNVKLYNRTPFAQTFLWWANPAVKVNDHYQSVFPPDVHAVFDHGKRDVSEFPIAKGTYYKVNYSAGVDISRYKNIPVPTSYMAVKSKYDFMGGYEHDTKGGLLHVANHHVSPGKKQWTWGNGEFGFAWDRNLTDEDGPYIELMTGVFTDNQPDFSWIHPNEERTFTQYFMPYQELGVVKNATKEALVNLELNEREIDIRFFTTSHFEKAIGILYYEKNELWREEISIAPEKPFHKIIPVTNNLEKEKFRITLNDSHGKLLVAYSQEIKVEKKIPPAAKVVKEPHEIESLEQLFLTGLHIDQYRHATFKAIDYYKEALRRDPTDIRSNNAMGLWHLKRAKFSESEFYFRQAINTLSNRNPNPYDGEPIYNLGLSLFMQERFQEAYAAFYKATWNAAWQDVSYLNLSRISTREGNLEEALDFINKSLTRNSVSQTGRHLKSIILRKLGRSDEAMALIVDTLSLDRFNIGCWFEKYLLMKNSHASEADLSLQKMKELSRGNVHTYSEFAFDYAHAGLYDEAKELLLISITTPSAVYPMIHYYLGYFSAKKNDRNEAASFFKQAAQDPADYCFPNRIEDVAVLSTALRLNRQDPRACYYLGNFWYANQQFTKAIQCWEKSIQLDDKFPVAHRNLALAYHNKLNRPVEALTELEQAFVLDQRDARILMELDQLYKKLNKPHQERLAFLENHLAATEEREDMYIERIALYNQVGDYSKAKELISQRKFHPWEGGEGKLVSQYLICHTELAKKAMDDSNYHEALSLLTQAETYPHNLGEGKLFATQENDIFYLKGCVYEALGETQKSKEYFLKATVGLNEPTQAVYYNDQHPEKIFYQGLAWKKLGESDKAEKIFNGLISFGKKHMNDKIKPDYFAVSLPDLLVFDQDLDQKNKNHCHFLIGLGCLGLNNGKQVDAENHFNTILQNDINHFGASLHRKMIYSQVLV